MRRAELEASINPKRPPAFCNECRILRGSWSGKRYALIDRSSLAAPRIALSAQMNFKRILIFGGIIRRCERVFVCSSLCPTGLKTGSCSSGASAFELDEIGESVVRFAQSTEPKESDSPLPNDGPETNGVNPISLVVWPRLFQCIQHCVVPSASGCLRVSSFCIILT